MERTPRHRVLVSKQDDGGRVQGREGCRCSGQLGTYKETDQIGKSVKENKSQFSVLDKGIASIESKLEHQNEPYSIEIGTGIIGVHLWLFNICRQI